MTWFTAESFRFLSELAANNERDWFDQHRERYLRHVREPMRRLIRELTPGLQALSPHYRGDDRLVGGSMFRIHRDVRFSRNKAPYKPWAGARFWHQQTRRGESPHFYLHVAPGHVFVGAGIWRPPSAMLARIRAFLHHNPRTWLDLHEGTPFAEHFHPGGERLKRMPRGYDADDPVAEDLKRKDFVASAALTDADALAPDFDERILARYRDAAPFVDYLCAALDLEF